MPEALIVDDDRLACELLAALVRGSGFSTRVAWSLEETRRELAAEHPDLLVMDLHLPDGLALEIVDELAFQEHSPMTVIVTGDPSLETAATAIIAGAVDYLVKPVDIERLRELLLEAGGDAIDIDVA